MDVINMPLHVPFVAQGVFPITALPDAAFAFADPAR
jgi:hypothetical protein